MASLTSPTFPRHWYPLVIIITAIARSWAFTSRPAFVRPVIRQQSSLLTRWMSDDDGQTFIFFSQDDDDLEEEEDDEEDEEPDPYQKLASSEFLDDDDKAGKLVATDESTPTTNMDWGGALGKLRKRVDDVETGKSQDPSHALFRLMSSQSPNQAIGQFISNSNPQDTQAMSQAVASLLGGLSNPTSGIETIVKASGDKVASLCFQLQMTGYLFRNAEYVLALKGLMKLRGSTSLDEYKEAFDRLDSDDSGFIESSDIAKLLDDVYDGKTPNFEIKAFLKFFDKNSDGKISWDEFQRGLLGVADNARIARQDRLLNTLALPGAEEEEDEAVSVEPHVSGIIQVELDDGKVVEVDAKEYVTALRTEAKALKDALQREKGMKPRNGDEIIPGVETSATSIDEYDGIASYIASRQGDVKALTEGISPEIVETMKMLVDYVLEGGESAKVKDVPKEQMEMEIPGSALQQLALWQLILGYRLREAEAKGEYLKLLE